jgi:hypothetical protein
MRLRGVALLCLGIGACGTHPETVEQRYQHWLDAGHRSQASAYDTFLRTQGVGQVVPLHELLRSGRRWRRCGVDEFVLPPRKGWAGIKPTLELVADLRTAGILQDATVASAWRSFAFNRCEGGSGASRHLANNALDFDINGSVDVRKLCTYWRTHGVARKFGLGFYSAQRIHVDTSGFRTWGQDHHRGSSLCTQGASAPNTLDGRQDPG